ncbi:hypothetical protein HDU67_007053 [Dinochytrium kinnereticum]|nr:hypothetical protein HDU67_007053 [Dinochytrium kinnereticum]
MPKGRRTHKKSGNTSRPRGTSNAPAFIQKGARGGTFFTVNPGDLSTVELLHTTLLSSSNPSLRQGKERIRKQDKILLIGEGDFSFAEALSTSLGYPLNSNDPGLMVATSLDSYQDLGNLHPMAPERCQKLRSKGLKVFHRVDATQLSTDGRLAPPLAPFTRIAFNFPHMGGGSSKEDVEKNREMLTQFFTQAKHLLHVPSKKRKRVKQGDEEGEGGGQILVALRSSSFYEKFRITELAESVGLVEISREPFEVDRWSALGYIPQRTTPAVRAAPSMEGAELHVFGVNPDVKFTPVLPVRVEPVRKERGGVKKAFEETGKTNSAAKPAAEEVKPKIVPAAKVKRGRNAKAAAMESSDDAKPKLVEVVIPATKPAEDSTKVVKSVSRTPFTVQSRASSGTQALAKKRKVQ